LYLEEVMVQTEADAPPTTELRRICRNCGYHETMESGLVLEIDLKEKTSEGYKILMNEFTKDDPTLPHVHTIKCPNQDCDSNRNVPKVKDEQDEKEDLVAEYNEGVESDVIYLKYDAINMKYLYICNVCDTKWRSKSG
jgi:DNA-directed RNA polymerase subunit M/transcription elongation factor TFIIS